MKFTIASAAIIASATAIPLSNTTAPTTLTTSYLPSATTAYQHADVRIQPEAISLYHGSSGAVEFNVYEGHIEKKQTSGDDITTLATFYIPSSAAGYQCSFGFDVDNSVEVTPYPGAQFDVFTSIKSAWQSSASWPSGNLRDQHVGRMVVNAQPGAATYVDGQPSAAKKFPCPAGNYIAGELVPTGENMDICFAPSSTAGPYITIHY
jgi:hypothetical protein